MKVENGFTFFFFNELSCEEKKLCKQKSYIFLQDLNKEYPAFRRWFECLFMFPDCLASDREILFCVKGNHLAGIAILKRTWEEQKICTLRVDQRFQRMSAGRTLMKMSFEWLENDKPLITVHKSKLREFDRLFQYYGFVLEDRKWCYYKPFQTELAFNGELPRKSVFPEWYGYNRGILLPGYAGMVQ